MDYYTESDTNMIRYGILFGCFLILLPVLYIFFVLVIFEFIEFINRLIDKFRKDN